VVCSRIKRVLFNFVTTCGVLFSIQIFVGCRLDNSPQNWPSNGTVIKNIKWELPLSDSQNVLIKNGDLWELPQASEGTLEETTYTSYRIPILLDYSKILERVDQEAVHSNDANIVEFYRFEKGDVFLLGYTNPGDSGMLTLIDPPLLIMPQNINKLDKDIVSTGTAKKWNWESFEKGYKTTFKISKKDRGEVDLGNNKIQNAVLCEMTISQDAGLQYGETNLILLDALTMKSNVLIFENEGSVLEWGIRERKSETGNDYGEIPNRELYIEITKHY
jgi:hypothetical protein